MKQFIPKYYEKTTRILAIIIAVCTTLACLAFPTMASAAESKTNVAGKVYEFDRDNNYKFSEATDYLSSTTTQTYGQFSISGKEVEVRSTGMKDSVPAFSVESGVISISYSYSDALLKAAENEWHLIEDKEKNIDVFKMENNIQKGALILQRSIDHLNWNNVAVQTNAFENTPIQNGSIYDTLDVELINGCYYRLVVVYELSRLVGSHKVVLVSVNDYEYKRVAEVYEFYAEMDNEHIEELKDNTKKYRLGETAVVNDFASYFGTKEMKTNDIHYGWKLGDFFVSGYTSTAKKDGQTVFLKNVGDVVTLWFNLGQNINSLNNSGNLKITADSDGQDQYFKTPKTNFGRGMLIIRYTDYENVAHEPVMYYDYLEANASLGANTRVQLFEEGDYEVALDYEVTKDELIDKVGHYRIFFKFSVRNANCMVYPMEVNTGAELTNTSITTNGFYLDLARSRYLQIFIEKEIWIEGAEGLTKDTRFNTTAKDGDKYVDEGIYTITVKNEYSELETKKVIYVGANPILRAFMTTNYSLGEIQELVRKGATIYEDGTIQLPPETYSVKHEFVSGTKDKILPEEVRRAIPLDQAGLANGTVVYPGTVEKAEIKVLGGKWLFQGWDAVEKTIDGANQRFLGTWIFEIDSEIEPNTNTTPNDSSATNNDPVESNESTSNTNASEGNSSEIDKGENNTSRRSALPFIGIGIVVLAGAGFVIHKTSKRKEEKR